MMSNPSEAPEAGPPRETVNLAGTIERAELIVAGAISSVSEARAPLSLVSADAQPEFDQLREAEARIIRVIAGAPAPSLLKVFFLEGKVPSRPWTRLTPGSVTLLLLRALPEGYVLLTPTSPAIRTLPDLAPPLVGASAAQAMAHELEQIILTGNPATEPDLIVQAAAARVGLRANINMDRLEDTAFQDPIRRAAWLAIALAEGKIEALDEVERLANLPTSSALEPLQELVVEQVRALHDPAARPGLAKLARSTDLKWARAASTALRELHDPAAVPNLIFLLDHPDQEVRYQAVMGLAELEPSVGAEPAFELYRMHESQYIRQWKQWWRSHRSR